MKSYPLVEWYSERIGPILIIEHKCGVFHTGQTQGMACNHPEIEGVAIPLSDFGNTTWMDLPSTCPDGCCQKGLSLETYEKLQKVWPTQEYETYYIALDYLRMGEGEEALIPVIIQPGKRKLRDFEIAPLTNWVIGKRGFILTQDNCD